MKFFFIPLACTLFAGFAHASENWPRFRGPNGAGGCRIIRPRGLGKIFLPVATAPQGKRAWIAGGLGKSRFSELVRGQGEDPQGSVCRCKDRKGQLDPFLSIKDSQDPSLQQLCLEHPALDGKNVYSVWGHPSELKVCAHTHEGKLLWEKDLGGVKGGHGFAVSPIVFEGLLIVPNDQEKGGGAHYALDCSTGEIRWKVPRGSKRLTYSTPCVFTDPKGKPELIFTNWWLGFTSLEPRTGKQLWELSVFGRPHSERAISSPIVAGDLVLGVCGFTTLDKHLVAIRPASVSEDGKAREIWRLENTMPHIPSPLLSGNRLYLWADNGVITCVRPKTGKQVWKARVEGVKDTFFGSPVRAGNTIFCVSAFGQVVAIADGDEFKQLGVTDLKQVCRSTPALANGDLYLRTGDQLICIKGE